jgi:hypothetical protein
MPAVITEIIIAAPPSEVRKVFLDFAAYPQWNPFITSVTVPDPAVPPGTPFQLYAFKLFVDRSTVVENDPATFAWLGGAFGLSSCMPFFSGYHYFNFEPVGEVDAQGEAKACKFVQGERFGGILSIFSFIYGPILRIGFVQMNQALKVRVEKPPAGGDAPTGGNAPTSGGASTGGNAPTSGGASTGGNAPTSGGAPTGGNAPTSGGAPTGGNAPTSGGAPTGGDAPASGHTPSS